MLSAIGAVLVLQTLQLRPKEFQSFAKPGSPLRLTSEQYPKTRLNTAGRFSSAM